MAQWTQPALVRSLEDMVKGEVRTEEPMARHTYFRIGGPADILVLPSDEEDVVKVLTFARSRGVPVHAIGKGSNLLVSDQGVEGVVLKLGREMGRIQLRGTELVAGAGTSLPGLAWNVAAKGLSGLEFGVMIPGTVGGAATMNAGAHNHFIAPVIRHVDAIALDGSHHRLTQAELQYAYRSSRLLRERHWVAYSVTLELRPEDPEAIERQMRQYLEHRRRTQPLGIPGAGSIFKNPPNDFAGRLIDQAGLKGRRVGDAVVSEMHGNFILNTGEATCAQVLQLIGIVRSAVRQRFGVELELEVQLLGRGFAGGHLV